MDTALKRSVNGMEKDKETNSVSFIVPTLNEEDYLENCLKSIQKQEVSKEIIVVDGGSSDGTLNIAEEYADKIIYGVDGRGESRDKGAQRAENELLVFVDADTEIAENFASEVMAFMENNDLDACATKFKMTGIRSKLIQGFGNTVFPRMKPALLPGFNTVVRKPIYDYSRGFEDIAGEDLQFSKEISKYGNVGIHPDKLVVNSGRRVKKYGLTGVLLYYTWKDLRRRKNNLVSAI